MNYAELSSELKDPAYDGLSDKQVSDLLVLPITEHRRVSISELQQYLFDKGVFVSIKDNTGGSKQASRVINELFTSKMEDVSTLSDAFIGGMTLLVTSNVITQGNADDIYKLGTIKTSRAKQLRLNNASAETVRIARAQ